MGTGVPASLAEIVPDKDIEMDRRKVVNKAALGILMTV